MVAVGPKIKPALDNCAIRFTPGPLHAVVTGFSVAAARSDRVAYKVNPNLAKSESAPVKADLKVLHHLPGKVTRQDF